MQQFGGEPSRILFRKVVEHAGISMTLIIVFRDEMLNGIVARQYQCCQTEFILDGVQGLNAFRQETWKPIQGDCVRKKKKTTKIDLFLLYCIAC